MDIDYVLLSSNAFGIIQKTSMNACLRLVFMEHVLMAKTDTIALVVQATRAHTAIVRYTVSHFYVFQCLPSDNL